MHKETLLRWVMPLFFSSETLFMNNLYMKARCQKQDTKNWRPETGDQNQETRTRKSKGGDQKQKTKSKRPEERNQNQETRNRR